MPVSFHELPGLSATVDQVSFEPGIAAPPERPLPFVYYLSIHNDADEPVTILGRKWIVTDDTGGTLVVEGDGVVGQFPRIEPGGKFSYNSYHVIRDASTATGTFFGQTDGGAPILVRVPEFRLEPPETDY
jgi:ApaG protein